MLRGITSAASGLLADERLQQVLANNLANAETPGFKSSDGETLSFPEQLVRMMDYGAQSYGAGSPLGVLGTGVLFQEGIPSFSEGTVTSSGRALDVAIVDAASSGPMAVVLGAGNQAVSAAGPVTAGAGGRLSVGGQPLAVLDAAGKPVTGIYAVKNPAYQGANLIGADGKPDYDAAGHPSYVFRNANGQLVGSAGDPATADLAVRVGTSADLGDHSFYAVAFNSPEGQSGIALTRDGSLQTNSQNIVVDSSGNAILPIGANGQPIANGRIQLNARYEGKDLFAPNGGPVYDSNGQPSYRVVSTTGAAIPGARLGVVNADVTTLTPVGQTEFEVGGTFAANTVLSQLRSGTGKMQPGSLEGSNVDTTSTMTKMIAVVSQYEANQRVIQTEDTLLGQTVTDVGKVNI